MKGQQGEESLAIPPAVACQTKTPSHKLHIFTACFKGGAPLAVQVAVKARTVQTKRKKMYWSGGYNYCLLQRGNIYYKDSEDCQSSQETDASQSSQETDSSQEGTEHLNPCLCILDEAQEHHEVQVNALVEEYKRNGDSENVAHFKAQDALLFSTEKNF